MNCDTCGNKEAHRLRYSSGKCHCDKCGSLPQFRFSDVYFKGPGFEPNLADPNKSPLGTMVFSREHKAQVMKQLGVKEAGDKYHGAR